MDEAEAFHPDSVRLPLGVVEKRVAQLYCGGQRTDAIAAALRLPERVVEKALHLARYKYASIGLEVSTRQNLTAALQSEGIEPL